MFLELEIATSPGGTGFWFVWRWWLGHFILLLSLLCVSLPLSIMLMIFFAIKWQLSIGTIKCFIVMSLDCYLRHLYATT